MSLGLLFGCGCLAVVALVVSLLLTPLVRRMALHFDYVDRPGERKGHTAVTPYGGGVAIFLTLMVVVVSAYMVAIYEVALPGFGEVQAALSVHLSGLRTTGTLFRLMAILVGGGAMFLLGLVDDRRPLPPLFKLGVQVAAAVGLYMAGIRVTFFVANPVVSLILTTLWVVGITNAMNLLDNMDGLSAGVGAIASFIFLVISVQAGQVFVPALLAVLLGCLLGFLRYNFNPASVFMGDAGSLFIGFILAATAVNTTYYSAGGSCLSVVMPVVVLSIPIFDTFSVMVIRWRAGKPLMMGDRNHFSHRLQRLGMTIREAVLTIYILSATIGLTAMLLPSLTGAGAGLILLHTLGILTVIVLLECAAARRRGDE